MNYLDALKDEANYTRTMNGAVTNRSTGDSCLDLFSVAGGLRYRKKSDAIMLFTKAYIENSDLAMKLLFYIRDIREGMGERCLFRKLLRFTANTWPESVKKNVHLIPEYGRFDDLLCLLETPVQETVISLIRKQLDADLSSLKRREAGDVNAPISLLAKWMPSQNASSYKTKRNAVILMRALGMTAKTYRKTLSALRANTCITERYLSDHRHTKIQYEHVPAGAMLKYRASFPRYDRNRYADYLEDVKEGIKKIHSQTLFPYEIVRPWFNAIKNYISTNCSELLSYDVLDCLWENLSPVTGNENAVCIIDTSGSMYSKLSKGAVVPALISQSLGLYHAERCKGIFHNHFITFSRQPELIEIRGNNLLDKLRYIQSANWGYNTNLEAVFDLILKTAVDSNAAQDEMPSVLYIISDMEFDCAIHDPTKSVYDSAKELFEAYGYTLPAVVFINVNSWQNQMPVRKNTVGSALASGAGVSTFKYKFDGNVTPMSHMLRVLNSKRYEEVRA